MEFIDFKKRVEEWLNTVNVDNRVRPDYKLNSEEELTVRSIFEEFKVEKNDRYFRLAMKEVNNYFFSTFESHI
ncbi:MAG: hypothetical protein MJZ50_02910 [Treponema sp.]|nr:hypothetical protein [Treponema sp.]